MTTVITHVWNEAPLLAMWLDWHCRRFDRVIVLDCGSTDGSREIAAERGCEVLNGPTVFAAAALDQAVMDVETTVNGLRIALNVTEFLLADPTDCPSHWFIPSVSLIDMGDRPFTWLGWFWKQRTHGISWRDDFTLRRSRLLSRQGVRYPLGRHFTERSEVPALIVHVANCLVDDWMIDRRLAIQTRIPAEDIALGLGFQHHDHGRGLTRDKLLAQQEVDRARATDCSDDIAQALAWL